MGRSRKKSSLKHGRLYHTPSPSGRSSPIRRTKSVPDSMPKLVHFPTQDDELLHIRTFSLAARPISISNRGSDNDDDSESESDEDDYFAPDSSRFTIDESRSRLPSPAGHASGPVKLDALEYSYDAVLRGRVRVENLAYSKRVTARFSLDNWESTSEVLASYLSSSPCGRWDTWTFSIRLEDLILRDRVLLLCMHYVADSAGEFWDNNNGPNYACAFVPARDVSTPPVTNWEPTHFPRRRSATVGSAPAVNHGVPQAQQSRGHARRGGWQGWTQNVNFTPKRTGPNDMVPRSGGKLLFVM